jgi:fructose-bisphosphate aldolase, class II
VAIGNIHGRVSMAAKQEAKVQARLNIEHLDKVHHAAHVPLVLHGGTGITRDHVLAGMAHGIAKINIATATRQAYMAVVDASIEQAQEAVYEAALRVIRDELQLEGLRDAVAE